MWDGMFFKQGSITDHFDIVNIRHDEIFGIVYVTVVFDKTPGKEYVFEIDSDKFDADKTAIGEEIIRQLRG